MKALKITLNFYTTTESYLKYLLAQQYILPESKPVSLTIHLAPTIPAINGTEQ